VIVAISDRYELPRWAFSAALIVAIHAGLAFTLTRWHEPVEGSEGTDAIVVDLAPFTSQPSENRDDLAPGPVQEQSDPTPQNDQPEEEQKPEEKALPPVPDAEVQLPQERIKTPEEPKQQENTPVLQATAPPKPRPSAAQIASWNRKIALQIERNKGYPAAARARRQTGIVEVAFTIDRQGRVVTSRIVRTSSFAALDQETLDTIKRAQPFPEPPPNMPGQTFDFTIPIKFNIRQEVAR
jgi:periplasmic protein TonB